MTLASITQPIIDISEHNGKVDLGYAKRRGVTGVIVRLTHGFAIDARARDNAIQARQVFGDDVAYYTFCNPKRGDARRTMQFLLETLEAVDPHPVKPIMLDIESYTRETPNVGTQWIASDYQDWLRTAVDTLASAPGVRLRGYTNAGYWNSGVGANIQSTHVAHSLNGIIGARFPIETLDGYRRWPLSDRAEGWHDWATARQPAGPVIPAGGVLVGWQFSAGKNQQGKPIVNTTGDLDLDLWDPADWRSWTHASATVPDYTTIPGDMQMQGIITNDAAMDIPGGERTYQRGEIKWGLVVNQTTKRIEKLHLSGETYVPGGPEGYRTADQLASIPDFA